MEYSFKDKKNCQKIKLVIFLGIFINFASNEIFAA